PESVRPLRVSPPTHAGRRANTRRQGVAPSALTATDLCETDADPAIRSNSRGDPERQHQGHHVLLREIEWAIIRVQSRLGQDPVLHVTRDTDVQGAVREAQGA